MIGYICSDCNKILKLDGFRAVNEVGRKHCEGCGWNHDNLIVVNKKELDAAIDKANAAYEARQ